MHSSSFACGVFTSWKKTNNNIIIHFAVNRFVGQDLVHYDLPSNNMNKNNKKRVSFYIELEVDSGDINNFSDIKDLTFVDTRFNDLIYKSSEYTLELSYTTKPYILNNRLKDDKLVECYSFPMLSDTIVQISPSGTHLWTEDSLNTKKIDIMTAVDIITNNIVRVPDHIRSRTNAIII